MKVLVTRPIAQVKDFAEALCQAGFTPVPFPVIEIRPAADLSLLERALANLPRYEWVVFTSVNAVEVVCDYLLHSGQDPSAVFKNQKTAAIGPKTARALQARGVVPAFIPSEYIAEAVLPGLGDLNNRWVLLPRAEIARKALPEAILAAGGTAHEIIVYHTLPARPDPVGLAALRSGVDWITFTSPSTVHNFVEITRASGLNPLSLPGSPRTACIGPITAQAAIQEGFRVDGMAYTYTTEGLIQVISPRINLSSRKEPC